MFIIEISCAAAAVMLLLMLYGEFLRMGGEERGMHMNAPEFDEGGFEIGQAIFTGSEIETRRDALTGAEGENAEPRRIVRKYHKLKGKGKRD
jgi:hypothetical protein